jgi:ribosomal protein L34E
MAKTTIKWMRSQYNGKCGGCGDPIQEGDLIAYDWEERSANCETCGRELEEMQLARAPKEASLEDLESKFED